MNAVACVHKEGAKRMPASGGFRVYALPKYIRFCTQEGGRPMGDFMHLLIWLILFGILLAVEALTLGLTTIWFAAGALVAALLSLIFESWTVEIIVCFIVSIVLLIFTRPWAIKYLNQKRTKTNYESYLGKTAKVTERIDNVNATGTASLDGQTWTARSLQDSVILEAGTLVIVRDLIGVKLIVEEKNGGKSER